MICCHRFSAYIYQNFTWLYLQLTKISCHNDKILFRYSKAAGNRSFFN